MMTEDELDKAESYWTSQEKDAKKMPAEVLREKAEAFLTSHNTCACVRCRRFRALHAARICLA